MYGTPPRLAQRSEEPHRRRSLRCSETRQLRASEHARRSRGWAAAEATRAGRPGRWIASLPLSLSYQSTVDLGYCRLRTLGAASGLGASRTAVHFVDNNLVQKTHRDKMRERELQQARSEAPKASRPLASTRTVLYG